MPAERKELRVVRAAAAARAAAGEAYRAALEEAVEAGVPVVQVAKAAGVSRQRLYQMLGPRKPAVGNPAGELTGGADVVDVAALEAELAELDAWYERVLDELAGAYDANGAMTSSVTGRPHSVQQWQNSQAGRRRRKGLAPLPTVRERVRRDVELQFLRRLEENPDEPVFAQVRERIDRAYAVRQQIQAVANAGAGFLDGGFR